MAIEFPPIIWVILRGMLILPLFLFIPRTLASAQELEIDGQTGNSFYYMEKTAEGVRFIQKLSWLPEEFAYRYEIIIEKQEDNDRYIGVFQEITEESFIICSLPSGNYRYRVWVQDLLGRPREPPEWEYFEIIPALQPELLHFSPEVFYVDRESSLTLSITGHNLLEQSEIYLQSQGDPERRIAPQYYSPAESGESGVLYFDTPTLIPDKYNVFVRNPGGLETLLGTLKVAHSINLDMMVSLVYAPLFPLQGVFFRDIFDTALIPIGFAARLALIPLKNSSGSIGFELFPSWTYWSFSEGAYSVYAQLTGLQMNIFFKKWFLHQTIGLNIYMGGGIILIHDVHFQYGSKKTEPLFTWIPSMSMGIVGQWFIGGPFFIELGVEFVRLFSADQAIPGYIRPTLGIGWKW